jgi:hypothetical protein
VGAFHYLELQILKHMTHLKYIRCVFLVLMASAALWGCEQEVAVVLNDATPKVVIEGWVTDQPGPYDIKVSKTSPYLGEGEDVLVSGAFLVLKDDMGGADTLVEVRPGWYQTTHLQGQLQHTFTLEVTVEGTKYTASDYLPRINDLLGTGYEYNDTMIFGAGYYVGMLALEPAGIGDFYQFRFIRNDTVFNDIIDLIVTDDRYADGQLAPFVFPYPCRIGDTVVIEVKSISPKTYDFFVTLFQQGAGTGGPFASVPDNLATNFDNGAVGWFGAAGSRKDTVVIQ